MKKKNKNNKHIKTHLEPLVKVAINNVEHFVSKEFRTISTV